MPIYEYECGECGKSFEAFLRANDKPVKKCEYCQSRKVRKLVSNCSFQLKGTGWYATDYAKKDGNNNGGSAKKKEAAANASSGETKADKKESAKSSSDSKSTETKSKSSEQAA